MNLEIIDLKKDGFVKCDKVEEILKLGVAVKENVVLFGKGGHGKSMMVDSFFKQSGIEPYVKALGQGSTIEDILGGLKMKLFTEEGKIEFEVENSFMNHEYVVFEEAFDAPMQVLEQLKDILTSGKFRNGNQIYDVKTKMIVVCTNRTKDEIAEDNSIKALMERFALELKVEWDSYEVEDYSEMFQAQTNDSEFLFSSLIVRANEKTFISPRTAMKALKVFKKGGLDLLTYITGFNQNIIDELKIVYEELKRLVEQKDLIIKYNNQITDTLLLLEFNNNVDEIITGIKVVKDIRTELQNIVWNDEVSMKYLMLLNVIDESILILENRLEFIDSDKITATNF